MPSLHDLVYYGMFGMFAALCVCAVPAFIGFFFIVCRALWELVTDA